MARKGPLAMAATKAGNLGFSYACPRGHVLRYGVKECIDQAGLAAVQALKAVKSDVGRA